MGDSQILKAFSLMLVGALIATIGFFAFDSSGSQEAELSEHVRELCATTDGVDPACVQQQRALELVELLDEYCSETPVSAACVQLAIEDQSVRQTLEAMGLVRIVSRSDVPSSTPIFWPQATDTEPVTITVDGSTYTIRTPAELAAYNDCDIGVRLGSADGPRVSRCSN
jgi:hypothetical protein